MSNILQDGATWLGDQLKSAAGRSITLTRGTRTTPTITGVVTSVDYDEIGDDGLTTSVRYDDWTFAASDVLMNSVQIEPRDGDILTETLSGTVIKYEVLPLQNRPSFEWLDSSGILILVHTKRIG